MPELPSAARGNHGLASLSDLMKVPAHVSRLWPLVAAGLVLELVWLTTAALTYPLTGSPAYARNWRISLGPIWSGFEWLLVQIDTLVPGTYTGELPHMPAFVLFLITLFVGYATYLFAISLLDRGLGSHPAALRIVAMFALLFQATLWFMPGILTTDLASYAMYGRIAGVYDTNPYIVPPAAFPTDLFLPWWISRMWIPTTSSYGPLWIDLSWLIARITGGMDQIAQMVTYRLLVNVAHLANLVLVWWLIRRLCSKARLATFIAYAWSPLLLFEIAANGHNDAVMILFMLLAVAALVRGLVGSSAVMEMPGATAVRLGNRAWVLALTLLALATLVKWTSALVAMLCVVAWVRCLAGWPLRLVWLGSTGAMISGLTLVIAWPWLPGFVTSGAPLSNVDVGPSNWLMDVPAAWLAAHVLDRGGLAVDQARTTARAMFAAPAVAAFAVVVVVELRRVWRLARPQAPIETVRVILGGSTRALLVALVLASPQVLPWYFSWPLTLGLLLGWRDMTARVALAYSVLFPFVAYLRDRTGAPPVDPLLVAYAVLPIALPVAAWLRRHPDARTTVLGVPGGRQRFLHF